MATTYLTWDGEIHGPEVRFARSANSPEALTPTTNSYYWSEILVGGEKRKFYLNVSGWTLQEFRQAVGSGYESVLQDCLRNHIQQLIENHGWIPVRDDEHAVSAEEMSKHLEYVRP